MPFSSSAFRTNRPRARVLLEGFSRSGGVRVLTTATNALVAAGYDTELWVPDYSSAPAFALAPGVSIRRIPTRGSRATRRVQYQATLFLHSARNTDLCLLSRHRLLAAATSSSALLPSLHRPQLLYLIQHRAPLAGAAPEWLPTIGRRAYDHLVRLGYERPIRYVAVSRWLLDETRAVSGQVISNGVNLDVFRPKQSEYLASATRDPFTIGVIARPGWVKGFDTFLAAAQRIRPPAGRRLLLRLAMPPGETVPVRTPHAFETVSPATDEEMADFYRSLDVFVFPSRREGFGLPPLEAMACGTPVLSTRCGGVTDFATTANCWLIPPDRPVLMAQGIQLLADDPTRRSALAEEGIVTAQRFSTWAMEERYTDLFRELMELATPHVGIPA